MLTIGIIGGGFVGKATHLLSCADINILVYDIDPKLCSPVGTVLADLTSCDLIFISVPTPMKRDGTCCIDIVSLVVANLSELMDLDEKCVVVRSTVPPGTSDSLNCYFMPEFLTEKNYEQDFKTCPQWIFGLKNSEHSEQNDRFMKTITELFETSDKAGKIASSRMKFLTNSEAEVVKLFRNTFLTTKVSFCNEFEEFCTACGVSYQNIINIAAEDARIGTSHTMVPGHDGKRGFGGTCFPKDIANVSAVMKEKNMKSYIIDAVIDRNSNHDRKEQDWNDNKGRSVV